MFLAFFRSGLVTEADWESWKNEDFQPYIDVSGTFIVLCVCLYHPLVIVAHHGVWEPYSTINLKVYLTVCQSTLFLCCNTK